MSDWEGSPRPLWLVSYLIFLLEPVSLASLHLGDVLQQVGHPDGRLELVPGVAHLHRVTGPVGMSLDCESGLRQLPTTAICFKEKEVKQTITLGALSFVLLSYPRVAPGRQKELTWHLTDQEIAESLESASPVWL